MKWPFIAVFVVMTLFAPFAVAAQNPSTPDLTIGKKGEIHFNIPVKAGTTLLETGMYQIQHVIEGGNHVIIFKKMEMPAGYRHSNTPVAKESSARVQCKIEPIPQKAKRTSVQLRINSAGQKEVAEVEVAGEAFKHLL